MPDTPLDRALEVGPPPDRAAMPGVLAAILNLTCGITQVRTQSDGKAFHFRAPPSAGALYPAELYVALQNVNGFNDGLYHYCPLEHTLSTLREGPVFDDGEKETMIRFLISAIFHRSAWKYGPRAYRYCLLDAGHMAHNLLLAARIHGLPAEIDYDFSDPACTRLLAIDPALEGCLIQVHGLGPHDTPLKAGDAPLTAKELPGFSRTAKSPEAPELLMEAHEVTSSFARCPVAPAASVSDRATQLPDPVIASSTTAAIRQRRSRRNFVVRQAEPRHLVDIISLLCQDAPPTCTDAVQIGFLAADHSGLTPGYHRINRTDGSTTLVRQGQFMDRSARVCLDQGWLANAALHFVFTADLPALHATCGPRSYRYAHLEAGRLGQALYLAATAKKMGACGIGAFFDAEAVHLLGLDEGHSLLYLVGVGPIRR